MAVDIMRLGSLSAAWFASSRQCPFGSRGLHGLSSPLAQPSKTGSQSRPPGMPAGTQTENKQIFK